MLGLQGSQRSLIPAALLLFPRTPPSSAPSQPRDCIVSGKVSLKTDTTEKRLQTRTYGGNGYAGGSETLMRWERRGHWFSRKLAWRRAEDAGALRSPRPLPWPISFQRRFQRPSAAAPPLASIPEPEEPGGAWTSLSRKRPQGTRLQDREGFAESGSQAWPGRGGSIRWEGQERSGQAAQVGSPP